MASGYGRSAVNHLCCYLGKTRHPLDNILFIDDQRRDKAHHVRPGVEYHDAGSRSGIKEITHAALMLRPESGVSQQVHPADIIGQIKFSIQLLRVFDEQFALRAHAIQHRRGIG